MRLPSSHPRRCRALRLSDAIKRLFAQRALCRSLCAPGLSFCRKTPGSGAYLRTAPYSAFLVSCVSAKCFSTVSSKEKLCQHSIHPRTCVLNSRVLSIAETKMKIKVIYGGLGQNWKQAQQSCPRTPSIPMLMAIEEASNW